LDRVLPLARIIREARALIGRVARKEAFVTHGGVIAHSQDSFWPRASRRDRGAGPEPMPKSIGEDTRRRDRREDPARTARFAAFMNNPG
jgi:hypothetical protein